MKYTVDYFINKFEAIPETRWVTMAYINEYGCCAMGHCGAQNDDCLTEESRALKMLFAVPYAVQHINDGRFSQYQQPTPKQRILAALYDIKKLQSPEVKEKIVYVAVPVTITEQAKELVMS